MNPVDNAVKCIRRLNGEILNQRKSNTIKKVINQEVHREDMIILENVDFVHHTPMTVLPMGAMCEVNCETASFSILEPGVKA